MDRRDQELLDKQLRRVTPAPRNDGTMILAIVAVFVAGMTLGGYLAANHSAPMQVAADDTAAGAQPSTPPTMR
jgi:hypothetical protein